MKEKHLKILAGVFAFLLVIYFVTKPRHTEVNIDELVQSILIGVSKEDVHHVEIYKETNSDTPAQMDFSLVDDTWRITSRFFCKAKKSRIERIINDLIDMTGNVRSTDPKHHSTYEITDEQGIHIILKDEAEKPLANLIVGKKGEDANSGFVRFTDREKVYFVDKNVLNALGIYGQIDTLTTFDAKSFVDLEAVKKEKDDLSQVALVRDGTQMIVKKVEREEEVVKDDSTKAMEKKNVWVYVDRKGKETDLDQTEVDKFLKDVTTIRGQEAVDRVGETLADMNKPSRYGLSRPKRFIAYFDADGKQENVLMGSVYEEDKGVYMQVQTDGLIYKLAKTNYDKIFKWVDDLPQKKAK